MTMTNIFKFKKIKTISYFCLSFFLMGSIAVFISLFLNEKYQIKVVEENENNKYIDLNIANEIILDSNLNAIVSYNRNEKEYYFSKTNIDNHFLTIIENTLKVSPNFDHDINDFYKVVKYKLLDGNKSVIFNIYLHNKKIKSIKYKSYFKLVLN